MQLIKKIHSYKTRLMISTALTATVWLMPANPALAAACIDGANTGTCEITDTLTATGVFSAVNINTSSTQQGTLEVQDSASFAGSVYLDTITGTIYDDEEYNPSLTFSGSRTSSVNEIVLNDGTLIVNNGHLYVGNIASGKAVVFGTGTLHQDEGYIDSTGGHTLANLVVGSEDVSVAYTDAGTNITNVRFASADKGTFHISNYQANVGTLTAGSGNKITFNEGENSTLQVNTITAYDINSTQRGTLNITGTGTSSLNGNVYLNTLTASSGTLNIASGKTVTTGSATLRNVNSAENQVGSLYLTSTSDASFFNGNVYLSSLHVAGQLNVNGTTYVDSLFLDNNALITKESGAKLYVNNRDTVLVNDTTLIPTGGISDGRLYILGPAGSDVTTTGIPTASIQGEAYLEPSTADTYSAGYYSYDSSGLNIEARSGTPVFDFNGGVLWDYSGYIGAKGSFNPGLKINQDFEGNTLNDLVSYYSEAFSSNLAISNGIFYGAIKIRKGNPISTFYTCTISESGCDGSNRNDVYTAGNINISGGNFYISKDSSIYMYSSNSGNINISGGNWFIGQNQNGDGVDTGTNANLSIEAPENTINIIGGRFTIEEDRTLTLQGKTGSIEAQSSTYGFNGGGTLALYFADSRDLGTFTISSALTWNEGNILLQYGRLNIDAPVTVKGFMQENASSILNISSTLSIENNIKLSGSLIGSGELKLSETASAEFGSLISFGTISLGRGSVTFATGNVTDTTSLSVLNGTAGSGVGDPGVIRITGRTLIDQVNLKNSTLILGAELVVKELNFDDGKIIFYSEPVGSDHPLTLTASSTIWNTSQIITSGTQSWSYYDFVQGKIVSSGDKDVQPGVLTIKDGMTLTFADKDVYDENGDLLAFASEHLTVNVENGAEALFDSHSVSFKTLKMTQGTATVQSGALYVDTVDFGNVINASTFTIDSNGAAFVKELTAFKGSTVDVNGTLTVENLATKGDQEAMGTIEGAGTLIITGKADFQGRMKMDGDSSKVIVRGTAGDGNEVTADFNSQTGYDDIIGNMTVEYGIVNLKNGMLTLNRLELNNGTINLVGENAILALKQNPGEFSGTGNSISGQGILRLLDGVDINFGGTGGAGEVIKYLGGLQIGTGTATITSNLELGSVEFTSSEGGTLVLTDNAILTLTDDPTDTDEYACTRTNNCSVQSLSSNVISGRTEGETAGGTLNLVDGNGSSFAGQVLLDTLNFGGYHGTSFKAGTMTFSYTGESKIDTFNFGYQEKDASDITVGNSKATVIVNKGMLTIANAFGNDKTPYVYGSGTLNLQGGGTIKNDYETDSGHYLANLITGRGTLNIEGGSGFRNISFSDQSGTLDLKGKITVLNTIRADYAETKITGTAANSALILSGTTAKGYFSSSLQDLNMLTVEGGAMAYINTDTQVGSSGTGLTLKAGSNGGQKSTVNIADGKTLTVRSNLGPSSETSSPTTVVTGSGTLNLAESDSINIYSSLSSLKNLTVTDRAIATIIHDAVLTGNVTAEESTKLTFNGNAVISGDVTAEKAALLTFKGNTSVSGNVTAEESTELAFNGNAAISGNVTANEGSTITLSGAGNTIGGTMTIDGTTTGSSLVLANGSADNVLTTTLSKVVFDGSSGGTLTIGNEYTVLNVSSDIMVNGGNTLAGGGILNLTGTATGTFAMSDAGFDGTIKIGQGKANIKTNQGIKAIGFLSSNGGTLNIEEGYVLSVGQINTNGTNAITGKGTLNLIYKADSEGNQLVSSFKAPLSNLAKLKISGGAAELYNAISIDALTFVDGGYINLANPSAVLSVKTLAQTYTAGPSAVGAVYGAGSFVAIGDTNDTVQFSTGGNALTSVTVGKGMIDFVGNSTIGTLKYSSADGRINIQNGVTVTVTSEFSGTGRLDGNAGGTLYLQGDASARFNYASEYYGTIKADRGTLVFGNTTTNFDTLELNEAKTYFNQNSAINVVSIKNGLASFRETANINSLTVSETGEVLFSGRGAGAVTIGNFEVAQGKLIFEKDATISNGGSINGGTLSLDTHVLTVQSGRLTFDNSSTFAMRISRNAVDDAGVVQDTGYGRIILKNNAELDIRNDVALDLKIDYGVRTTEEGTVFQISNGTTNGEFIFSNNRYDFKKEGDTSDGLRYRLKQVFSAGEYAESEAGNQNQINTAAAFLDGELFDFDTKAFTVAEHLDALSQNGTSRSYLNALTALAPDVTNAMSRQPIALQSKISNTLSGRLNRLLGNLGNASRTFQDIQKMYGRAGGSPYKARFMRSSDYYRRAGYYDQEDQPVTRAKPAYQRRVIPGSQEQIETTAERKRWAKKKTNYSSAKEFGLWAQTFYNTSEYLSSSKPEGFSGDTTGFAFGADVQLFDVFALGAGYASTSSSVDTLQRSTDVDGNSFFVYGMYKPSDWFVSSVLNMTSMSYKENKNISGMTIGDEYDGSSFGASVMVGKEMHSFTPAVGLRYVSSKRKAHQDEIGQDIGAISTDVMTLVAEARMNKDWSKTETSSWHSEFSAVVTYDLTASSEDAVVNLPNGSTYTVTGDDFKAIGAELGASISWLYGDHVDLSAGYNLEWRPDYLSHTLMATFRYSF
ncbi:MAG: hypothetical protein IJ752_00150 [Alphaproteobacteria bacterium]|nr:hypothetical protein [Alphaproteobacteria bacterium]